MPKPKIYFIPQYIGPLKHFERFLPHLKERHDIGFLFIHENNDARKEMIKYCNEKHYEYYVIEEGLKETTSLHVPFFSMLKKRYDHSMACRFFLKTVRPSKIIATKSGYAHDTIFKEANRIGVETIVLQWSSYVLTRQTMGLVGRETGIVQNIYSFCLKVLFGILDMFYKESRYGFTPGIPKKIGVFTENEAKNYVENGYDPQTVSVVGPADYQIIDELKSNIESKPLFRKELLNKYGLSEEKIKIFVNLFRFHILPLPEKYKMTNEEHADHHLSLVKMIRSVFPKEKADIILKTHPTESKMCEIYDRYKIFDIKIYGNESKTEELLCLSDLYIGDPTSSVNYMVLASNKPAIFTNFSEFESLNRVAQNFYIKHVVTDENEFADMLNKFKQSIYFKHYDNSNINLKSVDKTIELIDK